MKQRITFISVLVIFLCVFILMIHKYICYNNIQTKKTCKLFFITERTCMFFESTVIIINKIMYKSFFANEK